MSLAATRRPFAAVLAALLLAPAGPAPAQVPLLPPGVDCEAPDGVRETDLCTTAALIEAEAGMAANLLRALTRAEELDRDWALRGEGIAVGVSIRETIETSQDAWLDYRDATCAARSLREPGVADHLVGFYLDLCRARLARARAEELSLFLEP